MLDNQDMSKIRPNGTIATVDDDFMDFVASVLLSESSVYLHILLFSFKKSHLVKFVGKSRCPLSLISAGRTGTIKW